MRSVHGVCSMADNSVVPATLFSLGEFRRRWTKANLGDGRWFYCRPKLPSCSLMRSCAALILPRCSGPTLSLRRAFLLLRCFCCWARSQVYLSLADAVVREAFRAGKSAADVPEVMNVDVGLCWNHEHQVQQSLQPCRAPPAVFSDWHVKPATINSWPVEG